MDDLIESLSLANSNAENDILLVKGTILIINERLYADTEKKFLLREYL